MFFPGRSSGRDVGLLKLGGPVLNGGAVARIGREVVDRACVIGVVEWEVVVVDFGVVTVVVVGVLQTKKILESF